MIAAALHWLGFGLCHQLPARSFFGGGVEFPVCARDTGIYVGFVASLLVMLLIDGGRHRSDPPRPPLLVLGGVFIAIMAWDGLTSYAGLRQTTNEIRLATGLLTGWSLPLMVLPLLNSSLWRSVRPGRVLDGLREVAMWLLALPVAFAVMWWRFAPAGLAYALLVAASIVITFTSVNLIIVGLVPAFEHRYDRLRAMWPAVAVALTLALVEIAGSAWLRLWVQSLVSVR